MSNKKALILILRSKLAVIAICLAFTYIGFLTSQVWFSNTSTIGQKEQAVRQAPASEISARNEKGQTGLMVAAARGELGLVKLFLERGADINERAVTTSINKSGNSPLNLALMNVDNNREALPVAQYLLTHGADPNEKNNNGDRPIHLMMQINYTLTGNPSLRNEAMAWLVEYYANINAQNAQGNTLIHIAVEQDGRNFIKYLKENYNSMIDWNIKNKKGFTPFQYAQFLKRIGDASVEEELLQLVPVVGDRALIGYKQVGRDGMNGLMFAVIRGDKKFVQKMIDQGIDVNAQDERGNTAMHYTQLSVNPMEFIEMLANNNAQFDIKNSNGETPLFFVPYSLKQSDRLKAAQYFINKGLPVGEKNKNGETVLDRAELFLQKGLAAFLKSVEPKK